MGKSKKIKERTQTSKSKSKFIGIGIIVSIAAIIGVAAATGGINLSPTLTSIDTTNASPVLGSESAPVTIIEFGDYQCTYCQKWNQNTKPLVEQEYIRTGKAKLIYVDFPIVGADSLDAHAASYCADEQGLYWKYHDFVYKNQGHENNGWARSENLKDLAAMIPGLDTEKFNQCVDSGKYDNRVQNNKNIATKSGAKSTPTFMILGPDNSGTQISGAQPYSVFQSVINEKLGTP
ncbi:MAG: DsbA family protein [Thaumarchaeota archaeon]|nr:DsbA family protein [Nitrososphaerota archaeon]